MRKREIMPKGDEDKRQGQAEKKSEHCCPRSVIRLNGAFHGTALFETSAARRRDEISPGDN